jgi:RHS repeat-associated protein
LGSPLLIVNASTGAVAERIDYDEFGNTTQDTSPGLTPFGFAGGLYDKDSRLVRFGGRDYDPSVGRWTSKDPIRSTEGRTSTGTSAVTR